MRQQRLTRLLPTHYFHVVFTLPAALRPLAHRNRRRIFTLLFQAAAQTLLTLGRDPARLGAQLGITAVLHTWTRELQFHPHVHCIVTGGGLALDRTNWKAARRRYLFPVKVLSRLFRGKFLAALTAAYRRHELQVGGTTQKLGDAVAFQGFVDQLHRIEWVVYAKRPFGGPQQVFRYLGRYTHRVGLSNHRLQCIDANGVRFATKEGRNITLPVHTFIRRFLLHVLPAGFVKIRHYGLLAAGNATTQLERARELLQSSGVPDHVVPSGVGALDWQTRLLQLTGIDLTQCPRCLHGRMIRYVVSPGAFPRPDRSWSTRSETCRMSTRTRRLCDQAHLGWRCTGAFRSARAEPTWLRRPPAICIAGVRRHLSTGITLPRRRPHPHRAYIVVIAATTECP